MGNLTSSTVILNTITPQGCVLSPLLYSLFTSDCSPIHPTRTIVKFNDDTTIVGLKSDNSEKAYRKEIQDYTALCSYNHLDLNISKTKEIILDFRKSKPTEQSALWIHGEEVESFKFLGLHISADLTWCTHISLLEGKAQQRRYFTAYHKTCCSTSIGLPLRA